MFPRREMLDLVVIDGKARGIVTRNLITGEIESHAGARGRARHRRLRDGVLPLDQRRAVERHGGVARPQARGVLREPVLHADPPDVHPGQRRAPVEAHADERVAPERRPRVGAEDARRHAAARADPGERARLLPRAADTRASATSCRATSHRATRRPCATTAAGSARRAWRSTSISPTRSRGSASRPSRRATATCSTCTSGSPTRIRTRCRCASTPRSTTRWAGCGWTTT